MFQKLAKITNTTIKKHIYECIMETFSLKKSSSDLA